MNELPQIKQRIIKIIQFSHLFFISKIKTKVLNPSHIVLLFL
jgi:hypothetical protein